MRHLLLLAACAVGASTFQCSPDSILMWATDKRAKQLERECHLAEQGEKECETKEALEEAWLNFKKTSEKFSKSVEECRKIAGLSRRKRHGDHDPNDPDHTGHNHKRRHADHHDPNDPNVDHTGHNHKRRHADHHDPNDPNVDHTGHNHKKRDADHDPSDPTIDHSGHNHRRRRHHSQDGSGHGHGSMDHISQRKERSHKPHDPNDPNIDHTGHNHKRRHADHDPTDPNIDHTGHNHKRRHADHDPTDPNIDHTGHNHKRRHADHDPHDPTIDHSGHNHKKRSADSEEEEEEEEVGDSSEDTGPFAHDHVKRSAYHDKGDPVLHGEEEGRKRERRNVDGTSDDKEDIPLDDDNSSPVLRVKRQSCKIKSMEGLSKFQTSHDVHCVRGNICLPDEDLPESKRAPFKELHAAYAKAYSRYSGQVSLCYGKL